MELFFSTGSALIIIPSRVVSRNVVKFFRKGFSQKNLLLRPNKNAKTFTVFDLQEKLLAPSHRGQLFSS